MTIIPGFGASRAVQHLACMYNPSLYDDYTDKSGVEPVRIYSKRLEITKDIYRTPQAILHAMLASQWQLDLSISYGAASISETALLIDIDPAGTIKDLVANSTSYTDTQTSGEDSITCQIDLNTFSDRADWCKLRGAWTVPLNILVNCSKTPTDPEEPTLSGRFALGDFSTPFQDELGAVSVDFCGVSSSLFENRPDGEADVPATAFPSGTITLTPTQWLNW